MGWNDDTLVYIGDPYLAATMQAIRKAIVMFRYAFGITPDDDDPPPVVAGDWLDASTINAYRSTLAGFLAYNYNLDPATGSPWASISAILGYNQPGGAHNWTTLPARWSGGPTYGDTLPPNTPAFIEHVNELIDVLEELRIQHVQQSSTDDGWIGMQDLDWSDCKAGTASITEVQAATVKATIGAALAYVIWRAFFAFDLSSFTADTPGAVLRLVLHASYNMHTYIYGTDLYVYRSTWSAPLAVADWTALGAAEGVMTIAGTGASRELTPAAAPLGGESRLAVISYYDEIDTAPPATPPQYGLYQQAVRTADAAATLRPTLDVELDYTADVP